jgi:hypothetical protein
VLTGNNGNIVIEINLLTSGPATCLGLSRSYTPQRRDGYFSCTDGHLKAPQPVFGGEQDGHDRLLRRIIYWHPVGVFIIIAVGLLPGQA